MSTWRFELLGFWLARRSLSRQKADQCNVPPLDRAKLPPLLSHPPDLITLSDEALSEQSPPPLHAEQLFPLALAHMESLVDLVHPDFVILALALEHAERAAGVARDDSHGAPERRLESQVDVRVRVQLVLVQAGDETAQAQVRVRPWLRAAPVAGSQCILERAEVGGTSRSADGVPH